MALNNPINKANLVQRYNEIVTNDISGQIAYARNQKPFSEAPDSWFGGNRDGFPARDTSTLGAVVNASEIFEAMYNHARSLTAIRNARMRLQVTTTGGSPWNRSAGPRTSPASPAYAEDVLGLTYLSNSNVQTLPIVSGNDLGSEKIITRNGLDGTLSQNPNYGGSILGSGFFQNLKNAWEQRRGNTVTLDTTVCHASCHGNCHGSRGRR
jgi:hypothetical protein